MNLVMMPDWETTADRRHARTAGEMWRWGGAAAGLIVAVAACWLVPADTARWIVTAVAALAAGTALIALDRHIGEGPARDRDHRKAQSICLRLLGGVLVGVFGVLLVHLFGWV